jgi:hypothetical protein
LPITIGRARATGKNGRPAVDTAGTNVENDIFCIIAAIGEFDVATGLSSNTV